MSLTPHHFCMSSARKQYKKNKKNPSSFFIRTSLEMTKSLGVHSESEEFDTWRNKERRGSVLFLKERRLVKQSCCCCWWRKRTDKFHCCPKKQQLSSARDRGLSVVCIFSIGQSSLPDSDEVTSTSFPSGLPQHFYIFLQKLLITVFLWPRQETQSSGSVLLSCGRDRPLQTTYLRPVLSYGGSCACG